MKFRVVVEDRAARDIEDHARWIRDVSSLSQAIRWVGAIEDAIGSLSVMPNRCAIAPEAAAFGLPIRQRIALSHRILFLVRGKLVHVLHVRAAARAHWSPAP